MYAGFFFFNKIQCFCFEEQRLRAGEEIDFFFLSKSTFFRNVETFDTSIFRYEAYRNFRYVDVSIYRNTGFRYMRNFRYYTISNSSPPTPLHACALAGVYFNKIQCFCFPTTHNIMHAGIYFNKIQCFCFEEQRLRAGEEIDMPVFFFLDPEMLDDPTMDNVNNVTLSYTFFQTAEEEAVEEEDEEEEE
ncbi:unnamed protein product, partial [Laminaria digitata]